MEIHSIGAEFYLSSLTLYYAIYRTVLYTLVLAITPHLFPTAYYPMYVLLLPASLLLWYCTECKGQEEYQQNHATEKTNKI